MHQLCHPISLKNSRNFSIQSEVKPKSIIPHTHPFSRALRQLPEIISSFDWIIVLFVSFVIGQSEFFGFGFTTLDWKLFYSLILFVIVIASAVLTINQSWNKKKCRFLIHCCKTEKRKKGIEKADVLLLTLCVHHISYR